MAGNGIKPSALAEPTPNAEADEVPKVTFKPTSAQIAAQAQAGQSQDQQQEQVQPEDTAQLGQQNIDRQPASDPTLDALFAEHSRPAAQDSTLDDLFAKNGGSTQATSEKPGLIQNETARNITSGIISALPTAGAVVGGVIGALGANPASAFGGGVIGGMGGKALGNIGEKYLLGEGPASNLENINSINKAGAETAIGEGAGVLAGKIINKAVSSLANAGKTAQEILATVGRTTPKVIETYTKAADEIGKLASSSNNSVATAGKQLGEKWLEQVRQFKASANAEISSALLKNDTQVSARPVLDSIDKQVSSFDEKLDASAIERFNDLKDFVQRKMDGQGQLSVSDLNDVKKRFQDLGEYVTTPGQISSNASQVERAAVAVASNARKLLNKAAPEIADANNSLFRLRQLEKNGAKQFLKGEFVDPNAIVAVGNGGAPRAENVLAQLDKLTGSTASSDAEKLAAMQYFNSSSHFPKGIVDAITRAPPIAIKAAISAGSLGPEFIENLSATTAGKNYLKLVAKAQNSSVGQFSAQAIQNLQSSGAGREFLRQVGIYEATK